MTAPRIVVAGVSGAGKSTLGRALADRLSLAFLEGDDFHPPENRAAMAAGQPLTDAMRAGWLDRMAAELAAAEAGTVLACSALKRSYRDRLRGEAGVPLRFLCLVATPAVLAQRIAARTGHFMPPSLLPSQLATWQQPAAAEGDCTVLDADQTASRLLAAALAAL